MPLRCLLFSSNEEMVQPIWQVLADLGIEGEYCSSAVDAVERVTTQLFQIVITDWDDQPEATFLLKTARDQKASQRPLTLAIVSDDSSSGSFTSRRQLNSSAADSPGTSARHMNTACQLLRSKQPSPAPLPVEAPRQPQAKETLAMAAAATTTTPIAPASMPAEPEKTFRAGEFLQAQSSAPGAQFDTECEVKKSLDQVVASEVDALTELEPMAAAVENVPTAPQSVAPQTALDGWASLQARLTRPGHASLPESPSPESSTKNELLGYGETPSFGSQPPEAEENRTRKKSLHRIRRPKPHFSPTCLETQRKPNSLWRRHGCGEQKLSW